MDWIAAAAAKGRANAEKVARIVDANTLERAGIEHLEALVRHGYKFIDIRVRKDGVEHTFEGDWLARLFRNEIA